jgi:hypothetical protein
MDARMIIGFKIGALLIKAMKGDAQGAALEVLDDFDSSDKKDVLTDKLANYLLNRYQAKEIVMSATDNGLEITLEGGENVMVRMTEDIEGLIHQTRMFIPDVNIREKFMELVTIEEEGDTTTLKLEIADEVVKTRLREVL